MLRGRLIWFESFMFGRMSNLSLHAIGQRALSNDGSLKLDDSLKMTVKFSRLEYFMGLPLKFELQLVKSFTFSLTVLLNQSPFIWAQWEE